MELLVISVVESAVAMKVLIADDHVDSREHIRSVLAAEPWIDVVAEAGDGREAVHQALELSADLVLMDISMPELNGIEATRQIHDRVPATKVLIVSIHSDPLFVKRALQAGACGYLLKNDAVSELVSAVESVRDGRMYLSLGLRDALPEKELLSFQRKNT